MQLGDYGVENFAAAFGAHGYRVQSMSEFGTILQLAMDQRGPTIIDVPVDYSHNLELAAHLPEDPFD